MHSSFLFRSKSQSSNNHSQFFKVALWLIIFFSLAALVNGQTAPPQKEWDKTFGGTENDELTSMLPTLDGGYLLGGFSGSDTLNFWVVKTDRDGKKQWDRTFGGNYIDELFSMVLTTDGGCLLGGLSISTNGGDKSEGSKGGDDFRVIKIDKDGNQLWDKTYGGDQDDGLFAMVSAPDGGYLLGGTSASEIGGDKSEPSKGSFDFWVVKIDKDGNKLWDKTYGGNGTDVLRSVIPTEDGGYLLGGYSDDFSVMKIDKEGHLLWDKTYGGTSYEELYSMVPAHDGGYLLGGVSGSGIGGDKSEPDRGGWVVKIDKEGRKQWDRSLGGVPFSMVPTPDGGDLLGGTSDSSDYWVMRLDSIGNELWDKTYGGSAADWLKVIVTTSDGGYLLGGYSSSGKSGDKTEANKGYYDYWIVKLGPDTVEPAVVGSESNTTSGNNALSSNTTGTANTAYGANALQANTTGPGNTGIGYNSMYSNVTGVNNTATGGAALALNTTGANNAAFGVGAGFSQNNFSSTFIGTSADATIPVTNSTALGNQATVNASNQVRIGNSAVTSIGGFTNWTNLSDGRLKKNVNEDVPGLAFISQLRPVTYNLDLDGIDTKLRTNMASRQGATTKALSILPASTEELQAKVEKANIRYTGFVAQEVEQAAKKLGYDFSGVDVPKEKDGLYGLRYAEFVVPLVKAVQEQQKEIEELKELVAKLSALATANNTNNSTIHLSNAYLERNYPNPHTGNTLIRYHLPAGTNNARIVVSDMKGQVVKSIDLNSRGDGQITLDAATLAAGTYNYSLWVGGKEVDTKRMVVAR